MILMLFTIASMPSIASAVITLDWAAPFMSGGGYCSEAFAYLHALESTRHATNSSRHVIRVLQHGDSYNQKFVATMPVEDSKLFSDFSRPSHVIGAKVSVCHSEPGAWHAPYPNYHTQQCPGRDSDYSIGRTMFETDRIPAGWVSRLSHMNEIWVPTAAAKDAFLASGVPLHKLVIVPEPVDTSFFKSQSEAPRDKRMLLHSLRSSQLSPTTPVTSKGTFVFLFVGKFEFRKGIHVLLQAFYEAFFSENGHEANKDVLLAILTSAYHSTSDFNKEIESFLVRENIVQSVPLDFFLSKIILYTNVPAVQMPTLYALADVLVIPSRGEGWGRPHVEAMSCGVPVIATNWSGPTAYLTEENGFPLRYEAALVPARGWEGHFWAEPSLSHLKELLIFTAAHPSVVRERGQAARRSMEENFSLQRIGGVVWRHIDRIEKLLIASGSVDVENRGEHQRSRQEL